LGPPLAFVKALFALNTHPHPLACFDRPIGHLLLNTSRGISLRYPPVIIQLRYLSKISTLFIMAIVVLPRSCQAKPAGLRPDLRTIFTGTMHCPSSMFLSCFFVLSSSWAARMILFAFLTPFGPRFHGLPHPRLFILVGMAPFPPSPPGPPPFRF